jgi:nitroreductase/NAD-dependent dihydropyrimidine dehydrogenase PreA subunit
MKISVNEVLCTGCGACVEECTANLFKLAEAPTGPDARGPDARVTRQDPYGWCIGCGHCLAVCPKGAILWDTEVSLPEAEGIEHPEEICGFRTLLPFLQSKRSVRRYRAQAVPRRRIEEVLEAMRWAPSGHNFQPCRYLVITDRTVLRRISDYTIEGFKKFRLLVRMRKLLRPFLPANLYRLLGAHGLLEGVSDMIRRREEGQDPILFDAPAVIIVYVPDLGCLSLLDPAIAFTYGTLAAHSLGLGSCWIGFAIQSLYKSKSMRGLLGIPADMIVAGVMILGYPAPTYRRLPPRNTVPVRWLDGSPP